MILRMPANCYSYRKFLSRPCVLGTLAIFWTGVFIILLPDCRKLAARFTRALRHPGQPRSCIFFPWETDSHGLFPGEPGQRVPPGSAGAGAVPGGARLRSPPHPPACAELRRGCACTQSHQLTCLTAYSWVTLNNLWIPRAGWNTCTHFYIGRSSLWCKPIRPKVRVPEPSLQSSCVLREAAWTRWHTASVRKSSGHVLWLAPHRTEGTALRNSISVSAQNLFGLTRLHCHGHILHSAVALPAYKNQHWLRDSHFKQFPQEKLRLQLHY